jgi:probable addiction module antidote protein
MALKTTKFDAAEYLDSPKAIAAYLNDAMDSGDADELIAALGTVARAKGMSQVARDSGLGRESLYKALGGSASPEFATVSRVMASLGLKVSVMPVKPVRRRDPKKVASRTKAK